MLMPGVSEGTADVRQDQHPSSERLLLFVIVRLQHYPKGLKTSQEEYFHFISIVYTP